MRAESSLPPPKPLDAECNDPIQEFPKALMPRASPATYACIAACDVADVGCEARCIGVDQTPPADYGGYKLGCSSCVYLQRYACSDKGGCHDVIAQFECCRREKCTGSTEENCAAKRCPSEAYAYGYCQAYVAPVCASYVEGPVAGCFAKAAPNDAGTGD
jgi:hypothetical protein